MDKYRVSLVLNSELFVLYKMLYYLIWSYYYSNQMMLDNEGVLNEKVMLIIKKIYIFLLCLLVFVSEVIKLLVML